MDISAVPIFFDKLKDSLNQQTFVKLTLSRLRHPSDVKNIYARLVSIKKQPKIQFTFRYATRDEVKNFDFTEGVVFIQDQMGTVFLTADLFTTDFDFSLQFNKKADNAQFLTKKTNSKRPNTEGGISPHDQTKKRLLTPTQPYFHALEITDAKGNITSNGQKKFKQIDKYIETIAALLREADLPNDAVIADFGSGKGYLTFALYDYLKNNLKTTPSVSGFELRENLVNFCNDLAQKCYFDDLQFFAKDINEVVLDRLDMLIALHACDTATDVAIAKGIEAKAKVIIVAPCCHKQVRKELNVKNEMQPILKHGILEERQAELLTDGIRALLLESKGYRTKVFEFVSTEHTPKNVMIVGIRTDKPKPTALEQVEAIKKHYGISYHHLEKLL
ncbi:MAG: SAM-dependent methyltransferase [Saprospiraceae bacterium]|nr:SAM-dependent methyltransferase [Saprospiraceae bacterium]